MKKYFLGLLIFCAAAFAQAQQDMQVVATVNLSRREPITVKQLKSQIDMVEKATGQKVTTVAQRKEILDMMINERLVMQAAEKEGIRSDDAEFNQQLQTIRAQLAQAMGKQPTEAEFAQAIQQETGMNLATFREEWKKQRVITEYLRKKKGDLLATLKEPTEAEINKEYKLRSSQFTQDETIQFSALIVPFKTAAEKTKAREEANKISREINGSLNAFDEKIQKGFTPDSVFKSSTTGILANNTVAVQQVGEEFLEVAFALDQGKVSKVIEVPQGSVSGFYIIKVTGKYPQKFLDLDDTPIQYRNASETVTVRKIIEMQIMQDRQAKILQQAQLELINELRKGNPYTIDEKNLNF